MNLLDFVWIPPFVAAPGSFFETATTPIKSQVEPVEQEDSSAHPDERNQDVHARAYRQLGVQMTRLSHFDRERRVRQSAAGVPGVDYGSRLRFSFVCEIR